jgi:hypothetical protein
MPKRPDPAELAIFNPLFASIAAREKRARGGAQAAPFKAQYSLPGGRAGRTTPAPAALERPHA